MERGKGPRQKNGGRKILNRFFCPHLSAFKSAVRKKQPSRPTVIENSYERAGVFARRKIPLRRRLEHEKSRGEPLSPRHFVPGNGPNQQKCCRNILDTLFCAEHFCF